MNALDEQKRKEAIRALINIMLLEAFAIVAVIGIYLYTNSLIYLIGGLVGSTLIFTPVLIRWAREHGPAMKAKPNSDTLPS